MSNMTKSQMIDAQVYELRRAMAKEPGGVWLDLLAQAIDEYRAEVAKEIEGLKGDVKSAEAAFERTDKWLKEMTGNRDELSRSNLGYSERATYWKDEHDRIAKEKHQMAKDLESMTLSKDEWKFACQANDARIGAALQELDEWKADAATSETKLEKEIEVLSGNLKQATEMYENCNSASEGLAKNFLRMTVARDEALDQVHKLRKELYEERGGKTAVQLEGENASLKEKVENLGGQVSFLKQWVLDLQGEQKVDPVGFTPITPHEFGEKFFGFDQGAPEGDKTVISWSCCGVVHNFIAPKIITPFHSYTHTAECHECGSKTTFGLV